jgi:protein-tyrosine phosphatase
MNFRDLGGIVAADGRRVKSGLLFRSGDLHSLSDEDVDVLTRMELATIIDFRASREIARRPDRTIPTVKEVIHIDIHDAARDKAEKFFANNDAKGLETVLIGDYIRMVELHQSDFKRFLAILATTEKLPLVYHCAAGKDRTGLATAILLHGLGVDRETIWTDYMATNIHAAVSMEKIMRKATESGMNGAILKPLLEVRREYLQAAIDRIETKYQGFEFYVQNILHADFDRLQQKYLE